MEQITTVGVDLAKNVFSLHGDGATARAGATAARCSLSAWSSRLRSHLARVKLVHARDLAEGFGEVYLA